jgi:hypothetical protein
MLEYVSKMHKYFNLYNYYNISKLINNYLIELQKTYLVEKGDNIISVIDEIITDKQEVLINFLEKYKINYDPFINYNIITENKQKYIQIFIYEYNIKTSINVINQIIKETTIGNISILYLKTEKQYHVFKCNISDFNINETINDIFVNNLFILYIFICHMKIIINKLNEVKYKLIKDIEEQFYFNKYIINFEKKYTIKKLLNVNNNN